MASNTGKGSKGKSSKEISNVIRLLGTDLDGDKKAYHALLSVKGVSHNLAHAVFRALKYDENKVLGEYSEDELNKLEDAVKNPIKYGVPSWMLNRRKDYATGEDKHIVGTDIMMVLREDINRLRKIRSYRGIRHEHGLPVRGQRTRSSFRRGATLGVIRKKK